MSLTIITTSLFRLEYVKNMQMVFQSWYEYYIMSCPSCEHSLPYITHAFHITHTFGMSTTHVDCKTSAEGASLVMSKLIVRASMCSSIT